MALSQSEGIARNAPGRCFRANEVHAACVEKSGKAKAITGVVLPLVKDLRKVILNGCPEACRPLGLCLNERGDLLSCEEEETNLSL